MKLRVNLKFKTGEDLKYLMRAPSADSISVGSVALHGNSADVEITMKQLPVQNIESIELELDDESYKDEMSSDMANKVDVVTGDKKEENQITEVGTTECSEVCFTDSSNQEILSHDESKEDKAVKEDKSVSLTDNIPDFINDEDFEKSNIDVLKYSKRNPVLDKIAQESDSYESFVSNVANYFEFGDLRKSFLQIIEISEYLTTIKWENIRKFMYLYKGVCLTTYDKRLMADVITAKGSKNFRALIRAILTIKTEYFNERISEYKWKKENEDVIISEDCIPSSSKKSRKGSILKLNEIAKISNSYDDFLNKVIYSEWLGISKYGKKFMNLFTVVSDISSDGITWNKIMSVKGEDGEYIFGQNQRLFYTNIIGNRFKNENDPITIMRLLKEIVKYKTEYDFCLHCFKKAYNKESVKRKVTAENNETEKKEVVIVKVDTVECMADIPEFIEKFKSVNMSCLPEERVNYVLNFMGLNSYDESLRDIVRNLVNSYVMTNLDSMKKEGRIASLEEMRTSQFINNQYIAKFNEDKKVKAFDFCRDLQKAILTDEEYQRIYSI